MIGKYSNWTGVLFRRTVIEKIGVLDLNLKAIDVDYLFRAAASLPFILSKKVVAVFTQHPNSYSGSHGLKLIWPGWELITSKMREDQSIPLPVRKKIEQLLQDDLSHLLMMNGIRSIARQEFEEAQSIADILGQRCKKQLRMQLLAITIQVCKALPALQQLVVLLLKLKRFLNHVRYKSKSICLR
jgi:hypothetical protein